METYTDNNCQSWKTHSASRLLNQLGILLSEKAACEPRFDKCRGLQSIANCANTANYSCKSSFIVTQPHPFIHIILMLLGYRSRTE